MAVFGVKGFLVTRFLGPYSPQHHGFYHFLMRYVIDHATPQARYRYRMYVSVVGPIGMANENTGELHLFPDSFPNSEAQRNYIEGHVRTLTSSVNLMGVSAAIRLFMS
jgi:hypothetical protein